MKNLYKDCASKATWCSNEFGKCILIVFGECANCPYFVKVANKPIEPMQFQARELK